MAWWEGGKILGGRDGLAGGTWLACTRDAKVAFITNVREVEKLAQAKSRGDLPVRFLEVIFVFNFISTLSPHSSCLFFVLYELAVVKKFALHILMGIGNP